MIVIPRTYTNLCAFALIFSGNSNICAWVLIFSSKCCCDNLGMQGGVFFFPPFLSLKEHFVGHTVQLQCPSILKQLTSCVIN